MRNAAFRTKLMAATMAPLVVLLGFAYLVVTPRLTAAKQARADQVGAKHVLLLSGLANAIQDERDRTMWYLGALSDKSPEGRPNVVRLRNAVDIARTATQTAWAPLSEFEQTLAPERRWTAGTMEGAVSDLETPRVLVDGDQPDGERVVERYNTRLQSLALVSRELGTSSNNGELSRRASGLAELATHRAALADMRVAGIYRLAANSFRQRDIGVLESNHAAADQAFARFLGTLPAAQAEAVRTKMAGTKSESDATYLKIIDDAQFFHPISVNADAWWASQDARLNEITALSAEQVDSFGSRAGDIATRAQRGALAFSVAAALAVFSSALFALMLSRSLSRRLSDIAEQARRIATEELPEVLKGLKHPTAEAVTGALPTVKTTSNDELGVMADAFNNVLHTSVRTSLEHSHQRAQTVTAMLVNLGRRNQSLIDRQLKIMDRLEANEEDPDTLEALYEVDHLVTRMRRNAENLLVLSGQKQARSWSKPVSLYDVLRSAAAEVSDLNRVVIGDVPSHLTMSGPFAVDTCHLLAELVENATRYSPKTSLVTLSTSVQNGIVTVAVVDNGVGMNETEIFDSNNRLANPPEIDELVADRVGFQVVGRLARKIGTSVHLSQNPNGGTIGEVLLPTTMFIDNAGSAGRTPTEGIGRKAKQAEKKPLTEARRLTSSTTSVSEIAPSASGDQAVAEASSSLGSHTVGLRANAEEIWRGAPVEQPVSSSSSLWTEPVVGSATEPASVLKDATEPNEPNEPSVVVRDVALPQRGARVEVESVVNEEQVSAAVAALLDHDENLPQRVKAERDKPDVAQFFTRPPAKRPSARTGAFAAVTQAKKALADHQSTIAEVADVADGPALVAEAAALPTASALAEPAVESTTAKVAAAVKGGLVQRKPGRVFSSAAQAADAGAFKRLSDPAEVQADSSPGSRFNALSKLQRGVSSARAFEEEASPSETDSVLPAHAPTSSLTEQL